MDEFLVGFLVGAFSGDGSKSKDKNEKVEYSKSFGRLAWGAFNVIVVLFIILIGAGCILAWI